MTLGTIFSSGIPSLDSLLENEGFHVGDWIAFIGEPGSMKTVTCLTVSGEWLINNHGNCVIFVTTETDAKSIMRQFKSLGYNLDDYKDNGQIAFVDVFSKEGVDSRPESIIRKCNELIRNLEGFRKEYGGNVLLVIDSLAPLWQKSPAMSRTVFATLSAGLKRRVDLCLITLQLSIGTKKGFGFGAEHGIDTIIRLGMYYDGETKWWIHVAKNRGSRHETRIHEFILNEDRVLEVGDRIVIPGRFHTVNEALENLKYDYVTSLQEERNELLKKIVLLLGKKDGKETVHPARDL